MYRFYQEIDKEVLANIQKFEEHQLLKFRSEFDCLCLNASGLHGWNYVVGVHRWTDTSDKRRKKPFSGYTATLQIDFTDNAGEVIEIDESICSFFENIVYVTFDSFRRMYRVYLNEELTEIKAELRRFVYSLEK